MIEGTDHGVDAVIVLSLDMDEPMQRLLRRGEVESRAADTEQVIRRREEV